MRDLAGADADLEKATDAVATAREKLADAERRQADATERRLAAAEKADPGRDRPVLAQPDLMKFRRPQGAETSRDGVVAVRCGSATCP